MYFCFYSCCISTEKASRRNKLSIPIDFHNNTVSLLLVDLIIVFNYSFIVIIITQLLKLDGFLQNDFHLKSSFDKTKYIFDQSIWECNGHFDHWLSNTKAFLCGIWNLHMEKLYPSSSSDLVLHSSINR